MAMDKGNWTLGESFGTLLDSGEHTDCSFIIGPKKIKVIAHKVILGTRSSVFDAMFFGDLKEEGPVIIDDFQPNAFKTMIRYIYTDKADLLSVDHALDVFAVADYYILIGLKDMCWNFIKHNINANNVFKVWTSAKLYENKDIEDASKAYIIKNTSEIFLTNEFLHCDKAVLEMIVKEETLHILSETQLIQAVEKWAKFNAKGMPFQEFLLTIKSILSELRYLSMTAEKFAAHVALSPLLTTEEQRNILIHIINKNKNNTSLPVIEGISKRVNRRNFTVEDPGL